MKQAMLAFSLASAVIIGSVGNARPAAAQVGSCSSATSNFVSVICDISTAKWEGVYAEWPSVALNISSVYASAGNFISEATWIYNHDVTAGTGGPWLEIGDTAGGGRIVFHENEWARMWYWVDGTGLTAIDHFYNYSPSDGVVRSYGIQWDSAVNAWDICFNGTCQYTVTWTNPSTFPSTTVEVGLEVVTGTTLDANTNSGNFVVTNNKVRDPNGSWDVYPQINAPQVDSPCGFAPGCLQGYWGSSVPPYTNWNNGKPAP